MCVCMLTCREDISREGLLASVCIVFGGGKYQTPPKTTQANATGVCGGATAVQIQLHTKGKGVFVVPS